MARPERSNSRRSKKDSKPSSTRRDNRGGRRSETNRGGRGGRDFGRDSRRHGRDRREVTMTKVTCDSCGVECEVPFKPTSNKPVYCDACFAKKGKGGSNRRSNKDFEIINEKLDKIMEVLKIK